MIFQSGLGWDGGRRFVFVLFTSSGTTVEVEAFIHEMNDPI